MAARTPRGTARAARGFTPPAPTSTAFANAASSAAVPMLQAATRVAVRPSARAAPTLMDGSGQPFQPAEPVVVAPLRRVVAHEEVGGGDRLRREERVDVDGQEERGGLEPLGHDDGLRVVDERRER